MKEKQKPEELAELFKLFGDTTRIRILMELSLETGTGVTELSDSLGMTPSAVSHQLKILKAGKLVKGKREGRSVKYSLADEHVSTIIRMGTDHINE